MNSSNVSVRDEFPSKHYHKYKSQSKTNPLFNKLQNDSGYPQDILKGSRTSLLNKNKNYLNMNKKNLKNFFSERLPPKQIFLKKQNQTIDPPKMFQLKRKQHQLKNKTKISLNKTIEARPNVLTSELDKVTQNFHVNDKNLDFKKKFLEGEKRVSEPYDSRNFLRGTTAFAEKYTRVLKKEAYEKVFGPDASSLHGRNIRRKASTSISCDRSRHYKKMSLVKDNQKKIKSNKQRKKKFSLLIERLDGYRKDFDPDNIAFMEDYIPPSEEKVEETSEMILWIQETTKFYKGENIKRNLEKLQNIEDIQKIDPSFYQKMNEHKENRLRVRQSLLSQERTKKSRMQKEQDEKGQSIDLLSINDSKQSDSIWSMKQNLKQISLLPKEAKTSIKERFQKLGNQFMKYHFLGRIYGFRNNKNFFSAFWKKPAPYEMEGSYSFFQAIKSGDLVGVQYFIKRDAQFMYEQDHKGRCALILACIHQKPNIVNFLLQNDIHVDHECFKKKTPLYYALKKGNIQIIKQLLLNGATPWTTDDLPFKELTEQSKMKEVKVLMKNARKLHLATALKGSAKKRWKFWGENRYLINQNTIFAFV